MIKELEVVRDEYGMWTHPDFPSWDENVTVESIDKWFADNNGTHWIDMFADTADEELADTWFDMFGDCNCTKWEPSCPDEGAFLLSIHDTDSGPIALFFVPLEG